ncbi:MAG: saccharopine dehydrogenase NADP-binding domain-containing protein [Deltaproteobacteria bacterium]|nr:saccharopine dehydrogenase NADP-binding domain-containing protein [Deltaproteobacteria bacterium]
MKAERFMIYGATGYTGKLIARMAQEQGLLPVLVGRSVERLKAMAEPLGLEYRAVHLDDADQLDITLHDVTVVLNAASPFSVTAFPLVDACLRTGTHYLDITGEIAVFEALYRRDAEARSRTVMVLPGVGFVIVPSDCLAAHLTRRFPGAHSLQLGISRTDLISRGSFRTMSELLNEKVAIRREAEITSVPTGGLERSFDYGEGDRLSTAVSWADVFTAFLTTGIPNIEVYVEMNLIERGVYWVHNRFAAILNTTPWQLILKAQVELLPEDPSDEERAGRKRVIVAEAKDRSGRRAISRLQVPESYTFTARSAVAIAKKVLQGEFKPGFQTPARVYGADFVRSLAGVVLEDL